MQIPGVQSGRASKEDAMDCRPASGVCYSSGDWNVADNI
jgi:hypothetical protein